MGRINLSEYGSSNLPSRERWEEMAEILYGDGSGKKDDRRLGTQRGRRRNRRPMLLNGGLTAQESLPASERTIDPSILYNTENPDKPLPTSALGSGNAQMDWAIQQNLVNAPKGQSKQPGQQGKFNTNYKFSTVKEVKKSIEIITSEPDVKIPTGFTNRDAARIIKTIVELESSFVPGQTSPMGAKGLGQIMPGTAQGIANQSGLNLSQQQILNDSASNIRATKWLLFSDIWRRYPRVDNRLEFSIIEYNSSPNAVKEARRKAVNKFGVGANQKIDKVIQFMPQETQNYLKRFRPALKAQK